MLDILRANKNSVLTWVLFFAIIVVFVVSFGPGSRGCTDTNVQTASYAAKVDGETVTAGEYEEHYLQLFKMYQARTGGALTRETADMLGLRSQTMNDLVERELVLLEAARHGVSVSDDDLSRTVKQIPVFQTDGRFDIDLYRRAVSNAYGSPAKYEDRLRRELAYEKMMGLMRQTAKVSDDEVKDAWAAESDRATLELVRFPVAAARAEVKIPEAEAQAFAAANGPRIEQFYKDNAARYDKPKKVRARHILVKVPDGAPASADEAARKKIEALAERVKKGEDFATLARDASDDPGSKASGGDLGFFGPGVMAKPFEQAAFALEPGQVSAPVRTRFGWHLIRVEAVQPAEKTPLDQVRVAIAREILEQEAAAKVAQRRAEDALAKLRSGGKLAELFPPADAKKGQPAKLGGQPPSVEVAGPFSRGEPPASVGAVPALVADAFAATGAGVLPKVYEVPAGPVVAAVKERQRPDPAQFAAKKDEVATRLRGRRENQIERAWLKDLREKAKVTVNTAFLRGEVGAPQVDLE